MKEHIGRLGAPSEEKLDKLWSECTFAFDSSVLLDLYRYREKTRDSLLDFMDGIRERIWLPRRVLDEFLSNRTKAMHEPKRAYRQISDAIEKAETRLINSLPTEHPTIVRSDWETKIRTVFDPLREELKTSKGGHPEYSEQDSILDRLNSIFSDRIGPPYTVEQLVEICEQAATRYLLQIPPGFMDGEPEKSGLSQYGDYIIWRQLLGYAKMGSKSIVFITNDVKRDWWESVDDSPRPNLPLPALRDEFEHHTGQVFYMYTTGQFLDVADKHLDQEVPEEAIEEIRELVLKDAEEETLSNKVSITVDPRTSKAIRHIIENNQLQKLVQDSARLALLGQNSVVQQMLRGIESSATLYNANRMALLGSNSVEQLVRDSQRIQDLIGHMGLSANQITHPLDEDGVKSDDTDESIEEEGFDALSEDDDAQSGDE